MKSKSTSKLLGARSWIEATFQKRECCQFIESSADEHKCCCGLSRTYHTGNGAEINYPSKDELWNPAKHTNALPTDAYGTIEFQGGPHPSKAQYVRLSYDTRPEYILQLFTREWSLELPKLLITVQGGKANFELQPKLKKILRKGLLKAAKTTGAWVFTGGTNTGVTRQVGDALLMERSQRNNRIISIGIAPWGIVEKNYELIGRNRDVPYHSISQPRSKYAVLNNRHAYFLLVDNGTSGRYGAEIILRRKLEKYISIQKLHPGTHCGTPVVCLVIEGGINTIRAVLEYVTDEPPVPVVVCDGSGRAADLIAFVHKYAAESGEQTVLESMKDYLIGTIQRTFEVGLEQAECLYNELLQCTRKKNLITVFRITERPEFKSQELDQTILTALFKSQHLSPSEQLSLALAWNRVDIARSEIFIYGQEWPNGALEEAMMQALEHDRIDFVKLLLENGVTMRKFLTMPRLEELYNTRQGPSNTLGYILRDVRPHIPRGYMYTLHDIGLVINKLMGGAYRCAYTRRKFRLVYAKVMKKSPIIHRNSASFIRYYGHQTMLSLMAETLPTTSDMNLFDYPFNELMIWAVLTKRQQMALLMWQHGEEALAKSLVACKLYKAMANEAAEDDLETEVYEELRNYGKEFENIALELLDFCYRQDDDQTQQLLTCELQNWSGQTCLSLAVAANHRALLAHPCSQIILADLWMGGLRTRKNTNLKVVMGLLFPPYISQLEFKSKEELQLMPQTEEEHLTGLEESESLDGEVKPTAQSHRNTEPDAEKCARSMSIRSKASSKDSAKPPKALLTPEPYTMRNTVVAENGRVHFEDDIATSCSVYHVPHDFYDVKAARPLRLKKKLYEFYSAPITKFWAHSLAYMVFLLLFSYVVLVKMASNPSWQEYYVISYICTMGFEKIREIISSEPVALSHKLAVWMWNMWNPCDAAAIIFFLIGLVLRLKESSMAVGRVLYCVDIMYWYLRILNILGVNKYLGPLVTMMGKMIKNMIYFVVLLLVVLMSFGVCRQSILNPDSEASWESVKQVFFQPYFMLYGEVFAGDIDPPCNDVPGGENCQTGRWITPAVMSIYLLVANILLINLLIAVFNNIFIEVNAVSHQVWMFQRFTVVMEYEQKPGLPPPLIILSHLFLFSKYLKRKLTGQGETYDNALKLFLEKDDLERLYDFEEECVEGYFREKEAKLLQSTDERIRNTTDRVENMSQKIEDINQKENSQTASIQGMEFRLRKLEDVAEQILSHIAVVHRFMATHVKEGPFELPERVRRQSESTTEGGELGVVPSPRRRTTRSLTEVRPPDNFFLSSSEMLDFRAPDTLLEESHDDDEDDNNNDNDDNDDGDDGDNDDDDDDDDGDGDDGDDDDNNVDDNNDGGQGPVIGQPTIIESSEARASVSSRRLSDSVGSVHRGEVESVISSSRRNSESEIKNQPLAHESDDPQFHQPAGLRRRRRSSSDKSFGGIVGASHAVATVRRQISQTHSEPEATESGSVTNGFLRSAERSVTWAEPQITVIPPAASGRAIMLAMHSGYTSITDELETVYGLLSPPRTPSLLSPPRPPGNTSPLHSRHDKRRVRHTSEMSNPEMALYLEKEHLRDAEDNDYHLMQDLFERRMQPSSIADDDAAVLEDQASPFIFTVTDETINSGGLHMRSLRRSSAIEVKETETGQPSVSSLSPLEALDPSKTNVDPDSPGEVFEVEKSPITESNEPPIVPVRRYYPSTTDAEKGEKFKLSRKLSRQESQGKVGRQNTLALDLEEQQIKQGALPAPQEEISSEDSLFMPTETMC